MNQAHTIPNLLNACDILELITASTNGVAMGEVCERAGVPRTTAFRILNTFIAKGLVEKTDRLYVAGPVLTRIGLQALHQNRLLFVSAPVLARLSRETDESSHVGVLSADKFMILDICESPHPIRTSAPPGFLAELHACAPGKVLLAHLDTHRLAELTGKGRLNRRTANTICTRELLHKELELIRSRDYALDEEEFHEGIRCLAAPVRDALGRVAAAISITTTTNRFPRRRDREIAHKVLDAARELSSALGHAEPTILPTSEWRSVKPVRRPARRKSSA